MDSRNGTGHIPIDLDRPRRIYFNATALAELEVATGKTTNEIFSSSRKKLGSVALVRAMLWAGLIHEDSRLELREAGGLIDHAPGTSLTDKISYVTAKVMEAMLATAGAPPKNGLRGLGPLLQSTGNEAESTPSPSSG